MLTPLVVEHAVNDFLIENVAQKMKLKSVAVGDKSISERHPTVISGFLLSLNAKQAAQSNDDERFPLIGTRILEVKNTSKGASALMLLKIMFGVYCPGTIIDSNVIQDASGYRDLWNMMETTRIALHEAITIGGKAHFRAETFKAEIPEEQPLPYWEAWITCEFDVYYPKMKATPPYFEKGEPYGRKQ